MDSDLHPHRPGRPDAACAAAQLVPECATRPPVRVPAGDSGGMPALEALRVWLAERERRIGAALRLIARAGRQAAPPAAPDRPVPDDAVRRLRQAMEAEARVLAAAPAGPPGEAPPRPE